MTSNAFDVNGFEALCAALDRVAAETNPDPTTLGQGVSMREVVWAARRPPHSPAVAPKLLASPRARRLLVNAWTEACPSAEVLDATVPSPTSTPEELALARGHRALVTTLHASTCDRCRKYLEALEREMASVDDVDTAVSRWTVTSATVTAAAGDVRGQDHQADDVLAGGSIFLLDAADLYAKLAGQPMAEPQYPTLRISLEQVDQVTGTLIVPGGMATTVHTVTVTLLTSRGNVHIPFDLSPRTDDDVMFTGSTALPPGARLDVTSVDIEVL